MAIKLTRAVIAKTALVADSFYLMVEAIFFWVASLGVNEEV